MTSVYILYETGSVAIISISISLLNYPFFVVVRMIKLQSVKSNGCGTTRPSALISLALDRCGVFLAHGEFRPLDTVRLFPRTPEPWGPRCSCV